MFDALVSWLLHKHFPADGGGVDAAAYVRAVELFARDLLPPDAERLARNPPGSDRHQHASRHTMDTSGMWFWWIAVIDCAAMLDGDDGLTPVRTLQIAAAAFGSAMDLVFRGQSVTRGRTRPQFLPDAATEARLRADVLDWIADGDHARAEARALFRIFARGTAWAP